MSYEKPLVEMLDSCILSDQSLWRSRCIGQCVTNRFEPERGGFGNRYSKRLMIFCQSYTDGTLNTVIVIDIKLALRP